MLTGTLDEIIEERVSCMIVLQNARIAELELQCDALLAACKALMKWSGPPTVDRYYFDSVREESWKMACTAIAKVKERK